MLRKLDRFAHSPFYNIVVGILFAIVCGLGYKFAGGITFVEQWGGSLAATIAIAALIWKTQGYWIWSIVNAGLWLVLFFNQHLPLLAFLQIAYILFALFGLWQWANVKFRLGYNPRIRTDNLGTIIAFLICSVAVYHYWNIPGYTWSLWWWLEAGSVFIAVGANWMDAFKYKFNWVLWSMTNFLSVPLFWHQHLFVLVGFSFIWQAMDIPGYVHWWKEERRLVRERKVEVVGGVRVHEAPIPAIVK
jgi:nicotinamide riboside transporter PnuC